MIASPDDRIRLNPPTRECWIDGVPIFWTGREFELLRLLVENSGRVLSLRKIFSSVWGGDRLPNQYMVHTYVSKLRARLSAQGLSIPLHTLRSSGYVLDCRAGGTRVNPSRPTTNQIQP